ncbi:hypothetical protein Tco_0400828 [Tanacetum coccineum]
MIHEGHRIWEKRDFKKIATQTEQTLVGTLSFNPFVTDFARDVPAVGSLMHTSLDPTTLGEAFSLARATEARFTNLQLLEILKPNPSTLGESFFKARITEVHFEDERTTIDIAKTNDLNTRVHVQDLEETIHHNPNKVEVVKTSMVATFEEHEQQENQDNLNEISKEKDDGKPPIFTDIFGINGGNDSRTSGSETPAKEVVDNGIESEVVVGLPKEFQEGDVVDALSRVEQKSLGNWKELDNESKDIILMIIDFGIELVPLSLLVSEDVILSTVRSSTKHNLISPSCDFAILEKQSPTKLNLKSKEPTLQVALDALKLTPFYNAFEITADVPEIYMQEFWVTVSRHHSSLRFKLNGKKEILSFIKDLRHTREIKFLSDVNVNHMYQPWISFAAIINKCLSGKITDLESLRLSRAQILWEMYHNKTVDYVYLLWEDLVYQVENKNSKKNNDMYYPRFTKVIVDYFMAKDQGIPKRNKMFWHYARDDFMLPHKSPFS